MAATEAGGVDHMSNALIQVRQSAPKGGLSHTDFPGKIGAGEEIRTLDPNLGKVVLYH